MAKETLNSVEVAKDSIDASWDLRVEEVTFDLINDWYQIKMEIAKEKENVALSDRQEQKGTFLKIANCCVKPLEYFNKINGLNKSGRIKKDLFFKNMKEEIIYFKETRFKKIEKDYNKAKNRLMQVGFTENEFVKLDDKGLNEIYKIAKETNI